MPNDETDALTAARESFSGRTLTDGQFKEAYAIAGILHQEIQKSQVRFSLLIQCFHCCCYHHFHQSVQHQKAES